MKTELEKNEHVSEIYATGKRLISVCGHTGSCHKFKSLQTKLKMGSRHCNQTENANED